MSSNTKNAVSEIEMKKSFETQRNQLCELFPAIFPEPESRKKVLLTNFLLFTLSEEGCKSEFWSDGNQGLRDWVCSSFLSFFDLSIPKAEASEFEALDIEPSYFLENDKALENARLFFSVVKNHVSKSSSLSVEQTLLNANSPKKQNILVVWLSKIEELFNKISNLFSQDVLPKNSQKPVSPSNCPSAFFPTKPAKPVSVEPAAVPSPGLSH
jgi:hypothetical protein